MHRSILTSAAVAALMLAGPSIALAADTGSGGGAAAKENKEAKDAKDLVEQAQQPDVATLTARAEKAEADLAGANGRADKAEADLKAATAAIGELQGQVKGLTDAQTVDRATIAGHVAELARLNAKLEAAPQTPFAPLREGDGGEAIKVTVLRGRLDHHDAPGGSAAKDSSFTATIYSREEADELLSLQERGVIKLGE